MQLVVYSSSDAFNSYLTQALDQDIEFHPELRPPSAGLDRVHLINISSIGKAALPWIKKYAANGARLVAICSDKPEISQMLEVVPVGARAYCNSYMQANHYRQMLQMVAQGQSWYPPQMIELVFELAQQSQGKDHALLLEVLTKREQQVALAVADGKSNKQIAGDFKIGERTVKTHLTNIFKKLELKDRVALVLYLK